MTAVQQQQRQQQQQQQQQLLYMPSQVPVDMEVETPAVYNSPRFQDRPIFGSSSAEQMQQAQQAHIQTVSADNPWAYRGAEKEPSLALPPDAVEVLTQGISFHDNSLFESTDQPQMPDQGISYFSNSPLAASNQQTAFSAQLPASPLTPANQGITYFNESPLASSHIGFQQQQSFPPKSVPVSVSHVPAPAPFFTPEPTLGPPAPMDTAQPLPAQPDTAQHAQHSVRFSPASTFIAPGTLQLQSGGLALYDVPPLGPSSSQFVTPVTTFTAEPTDVLEPVSDPLYDPAARALATAPGAVTCVPAPLQPLDDPLYDPLERRPVVASATRHPVRPSILLQPLDDPLYDPTDYRPSQAASVAAAPHAPHGPRFVAAQNSRFPKQQSDPLYDPAAVETLPGQKDVTHRGEQVGTPTFAPQQGPAAAPLQPPQSRARPRTRARTTAQPSSTEEFSSRPILGGGGRRAARTVNLTDIGRPARAPAAPKPFVPLPVQPRAEFEMGGADVLPQDSHYVKPTPYGELGAHARSALSGAGWKTTWAMEMEDTQQQQGNMLFVLLSRSRLCDSVSAWQAVCSFLRKGKNQSFAYFFFPFRSVFLIVFFMACIFIVEFLMACILNLLFKLIHLLAVSMLQSMLSQMLLS